MPDMRSGNGECGSVQFDLEDEKAVATAEEAKVRARQRRHLRTGDELMESTDIAAGMGWARR